MTMLYIPVILNFRESNKLFTSPSSVLVTFPLLKHAGTARKVDPKDVAKLGGTSLIHGCHLKAMESVGEGISNSDSVI